MRLPRGLSAQEAEAWEKVAATVVPLDPAASRVPKASDAAPVPNAPFPASAPARAPVSSRPQARLDRPPPLARRAPAPGQLDGSWDRKLKRGEVQPDLTLDLHGHGLDAAYHRLMDGVAQARSLEARTILLVTGKPRPVDAADRGTRRGAIRAKVLDWLAASPHHDAIAAVRRAHIRHGGEGALYIVLRRNR